MVVVMYPQVWGTRAMIPRVLSLAHSSGEEEGGDGVFICALWAWWTWIACNITVFLLSEEEGEGEEVRDETKMGIEG